MFPHTDTDTDTNTNLLPYYLLTLYLLTNLLSHLLIH